MRFVVLVRATPESEAGVMPRMELIEAMMKFNEELVKSGMLLAAEGLHPSKTGAARISFKGGNKTVQDGPFAETKELIGGFWIMQARSRDEVVEVMKRSPMDDDGVLEIRQIIEMDDFDFPQELRELDQQMNEEVARQHKGPA